MRLQIILQNLQDYRASGYTKNIFEAKTAKTSQTKKHTKAKKEDSGY